MSAQSLLNRVALVTGGSGDIGSAMRQQSKHSNSKATSSTAGFEKGWALSRVS